MRSTQPPHVATWLLVRLASGDKRESLIGDLTEQYSRGRSSAWYWRQTLMAVLVSTTRDIWRHKLVATRAVVLSWMFLIPWIFFTGWAYGATKFWVQVNVTRGSVGFHDFWVIYQAPLILAWCFGSAMIGWIVARLDSDCRAGMLFACAAFQLPFAIRWTSPIWNLANAGLPFFVSFPVMVQAAGILVVMPLSLWVGGLAAMPPRSAGR